MAAPGVARSRTAGGDAPEAAVRLAQARRRLPDGVPRRKSDRQLGCTAERPQRGAVRGLKSALSDDCPADTHTVL